MGDHNYFSDNSEIQFFLKKRMNWQDVFDWLSEEEKEAIGASNPQEYLNSWMEVMDTLGAMCGGPIAANAEAIGDRDNKTIIKNGTLLNCFPFKLEI
ncbi:MAG: hypothetical protein HRU09_19815, partial [Oligoflexales bacterium]|nr:hypothetical protein [Oligoflexales bacterium]